MGGDMDNGLSFWGILERFCKNNSVSRESMLYQNKQGISSSVLAFLFFLLVLAVASGLSGCVQYTPHSQQGAAEQQEKKPKVQSRQPATSSKQKRTADNGCSYFYFLWGRHAELAAEYEKALASYEKSLECNPDAEFVLRKVPLLLLRLNRGNEAILRLKQYLKQHPDDTISRMLLAKVYIRQGEFQKAAVQYRKIHQLDSKDTTSLLLLTELYLAENKYSMAKTALLDVLAVDQRSYSAHLLLARLLVAEENFKEGQRHYKEALDITWSEGLQLELADLLTKQEKYAQAITLYKEVLHHDEDNEEAQIALIHIYLLQGKGRKAMKELQRLKKTIKDPTQAELTIIRLYARWEEYDKAITLLKELLEKKEFSEARYLLAALHFQKKEYTKVLSDVEKISSQAPEYEDSLFLQVRTLKELHRQQEAVQILESALSKEETQTPDLYILLAGIYQFIGQKEQCRKTFLRALAAYPENEQVLYEYGLFLDYLGEQDKALEIMQQIISINSDHAGALNYIGYTWADKKENLSQALRYISQAAKLKPDNGYIRDSLGWAYYQQGEYEKARDSLEMAMEMAPDDPAILDHLAETYLALELPEKAKQFWRKALKMYQQYKKEDNEKKKRPKVNGTSREEQARKRIQQKIYRLERGEKK
ncbi:MAG: tetratricopeptide repeat protein [Candidatus Electrothrix sp. AS4_5]|nr:tetratricopeptide repeat protein [Candidatus Electrothrix gigas]